jgi:hypothetical protein
LSWLFCSAFLFWLSWSACFILPSHLGCPVLVVHYRLSCHVWPILLSSPSCPVCLSCLLWPHLVFL